MATSEEYAAWIVKNADKKGTPEFDTVAQAYKASRSTATAAPAMESSGTFVNGVKSLASGAGKGFGSVMLGAQRFYGKVLETADDIMPGKVAPSFSDIVAGRKPQNSLEKIAKWLGSDADAGKARLDAQNAPYKALSPIANITGEVGGSIAATAPLSILMPVTAPATGARVMGMLPRSGQAAAIGAAYGSVTGTTGSNANSLSGMLLDGAQGAGTGAVLSGIATPVSAAIGAIGGNVMQRASKTSAAEYAKQKIAEAIARDGRGTLATSGATNPLTQVASRLGKLGDEATIADAGGRNTNQLLDTLATLPGRTKDAAYNLLRQRTAGVGGRMRDAAESALDTQGQRLPSTVESLITRRQTDSAPLYSQLSRVTIQPNAALTDIVKAADVLGVTKLGKEIAGAKQMPFSLDPASPSNWKMTDLDHLKQGIDQVLSSRKAMNQDGTLTPLGNAYQSLKTKLLGELDTATTNPQTGESLYRNARAAFSEPSKLIDAANAGKRAVSQDEASIASTMAGMSANELQAFRIGSFEGLRAKLGTQGGQTDIMNMWKNPSTQEKLKAIFGDLRSYREFASSVAKEAQLKKLQSVGAGSQTASRLAGMGDLDASAMADMGGALTAAKTGNILSAIGSAKNAWNRVATPQSVRDEMGGMLLSRGQDGARNLNSIEALVKQINNRNLLLSGRVGNISGQASGRFIPASDPQ